MVMNQYIFKPREIDLFMDIAYRAAQMSRARRLHVGAVIVKKGRILSMSWNGTPPGWDNDCENIVESNGSIQYITKPEVVHAEANAILKLARDGESGYNSTLFCTHAPCIECAKMILTVGVKTLYWSEQYKTDAGLNFLYNGGVEIFNIQRNNDGSL